MSGKACLNMCWMRDDGWGNCSRAVLYFSQQLFTFATDPFMGIHNPPTATVYVGTTGTGKAYSTTVHVLYFVMVN